MDNLPQMQALNLPAYPFRLRQQAGKPYIFDAIRRKFVALTPEEWVRQHFLAWLTKEKGYPGGLLAVEAPLRYHRLKKRADAIVYDQNGKPLMILECKAPQVKISQEAFDQVARYNFSFGVNYLAVTNGMEHFFCRRIEGSTQWQFLENLPDYHLL